MSSEHPRSTAHVELSVPGLDHDLNLKRMVAKQERFVRSTVASGRSLAPGYAHESRNSLSLIDDPDVARIAGAIEAQIAARLDWILATLDEPPFRIGSTSSSCVCFRDGSYFRSHIDTLQHRAGKRRLTWVYYLNSEPKRFGGGDLVLYPSDRERTVVEPAHGRIAVFRSAIRHEVTPVSLCPDEFRDARFGITGFIVDRPTRAALLGYHLRRLRARLRQHRRRLRAALSGRSASGRVRSRSLPSQRPRPGRTRP